MSYYNRSKHDIGILKQDGTTKIGLLLQRDKNGSPIYESYDDEYVLNQQTTSAGYDALPPEKEFAIILDDWRSGFGMESYDASDPKRYYESYNMDMRFRGRVTQSYTPTAATLPTLYSIVDGGLEAWASSTNLTNWTETVSAIVTQEANTANVHGGTYAAKVSAVSAGHGFYQTATGWSTAFRSKLVSMTGWAKSGTASMTRIYIEDGAGTTYSGYHTGGGGWEQLEVSRAVDAAATTLSFGVAVALTSGDCWFDDLAVPTLAAHGSCWAEFNDELYFGSGSALLKMNSAGTISYAAGFPTTITDLEVFSDDKLYIAQGWSYAYWSASTAEAFTKNALANNTMKYFAFVHTTVDTMYGSDSINTLRSNTAPAGTTAWSGTTTVDASYNSITGLLADSNTLYIPKEDRTFYLDSSGNVKVLVDDTQHLTDSNGGKNIFGWQGKVYLPYQSALLEYDSGTLTWLSPSDFCTDLSAYTGAIQAVAGDDRYLFIATANSTKVEILAGHYETIDGSTSWVWHPIVDMTLSGADNMFVSDVYQRRAYIAPASSADSLYYVPIPTSYGNVASDANISCSTTGTGYFTTPELHANFKGDTKAFIKAVAELGHDYDTNIYFECHYWNENSTVWTDAGDFKGSAAAGTVAASREHTLYLPASSTGVNPYSKWIKLKIVGKTNDAAKTPILKRLELRGILYPKRRNLIYCVVRCADDLILLDGSKDRIQAKDISTALDEAKNTATWPVTFYDINGDTKYVKVLSTKPYSKVVHKEDRTGKTEQLYYLLLQEVALS